MTLYDRLPDLVDGCNELAVVSGIRRRIVVCRVPDCENGAHFIAKRADTVPPVLDMR